MAAYCKRYPPFPLDPEGPLVSEAVKSLTAHDAVAPEGLDAIFSLVASIRRHIHANPEVRSIGTGV